MLAHSQLFHLGMSLDVNKRLAIIMCLHQKWADLCPGGSAIYLREGQFDK